MTELITEMTPEELINSDVDLNKIDSDKLLEDLKVKCKKEGIKFHPSISYVNLQERYKSYLESVSEGLTTPKPKVTLKANVASTAERRRELLKLIRVKVSPLNPHVHELKGQVFSVSNGLVGRVSKYIPFNSPYAWHIPQVLYNELNSKKHTVVRKFTTPTGKEIPKTELVKSYAIEVLPALTAAERNKIAEKIRVTEGQEDY